MKITAWIILALTCVCSQIQASQFFALQTEKDGRNYHNQLSELSSENGSELASISLPDTYKSGVEKLALPESPYMFMYGLVDKSKAQIHIINKQDINNTKSITIDHLHDRVLAQYQFYRFFQLTPDQKYLVLHTGFKKQQNLLVIDVLKGSVLHTIPMSKYKNEVTFSTDENHFLINNTTKDKLTLIDATNFEVALTSNLGEYRQFGTIHNHHLYLNKFRGGLRDDKVYWSQAINLKSKEKINFPHESDFEPIFAVSEASNKLFSTRSGDEINTLILSEIIGNKITDLATFKMRINPESMAIDDQFNRLLIRGKSNIATINLDNLTEYARTHLPFDTANYLYSSNGELLYLKEGSGSEVAVVDVKSGELIERSGTGRKGIKFGQFMATVTLAAATASTGYMYVVVKYSNTGLTLNHKEDKLYVINSKTNDVTHFNANDLSARKALATGNGTFLVHQSDTAGSPLWVFSSKKITKINDQSFEREQEIEYQTMVGFDMEANHFIIKTENDILTYDMITGDITNQWPMTAADLIWSER